MTKSPDAFKTISEVADELKLPQHVLRFWETRFSQIKPMKRGGGRRYYRPDDLSLLRGIRHLLYSEGYTIKGVQRILKEQGARHVATQWLDAGDDHTVAQPNEASDVAPQAPLQPAAPIPVPPTAVMQPMGQVAEPVVAPQAPVPSPEPAQVAPQPPVAVQAAPVAPAATPEVQLAAPQAQVAQPETVQQQAPQPQAAQPQTAQPVVAQPSVQPTEPQKQAVMPPFAITHGVPGHLVEAITPTSTLIEPIAIEDEASTRSADVMPADILGEGEKGEGIARTIGKGLLDKFTGFDDGDTKKQGQSILPRGDVERLQATLVDLLECKRLLDQIR